MTARRFNVKYRAYTNQQQAEFDERQGAIRYARDMFRLGYSDVLAQTQSRDWQYRPVEDDDANG